MKGTAGRWVSRKCYLWKGSFASLHLLTGIIEWRLSPTWLTKDAVCSFLVPQSKQNRQVPNLEPEAWSPGLCLLLSCWEAKQIDVKRLTKEEGPAWAALSVQPGKCSQWGQVQSGEGGALGSSGDFLYKPCPLSTSDGIPGDELAS